VSPKHSIDFCPICGGGLCGIRICGLPAQGDNTLAGQQDATTHGLVMCDECEAIWLEPDVSSDHQYPDAETAACPVCTQTLWGENSRWADQDDIQTLGWSASVNHELDVNPDQGIV